MYSCTSIFFVDQDSELLKNDLYLHMGHKLRTPSDIGPAKTLISQLTQVFFYLPSEIWYL